MTFVQNGTDTLPISTSFHSEQEPPPGNSQTVPDHQRHQEEKQTCQVASSFYEESLTADSKPTDTGQDDSNKFAEVSAIGPKFVDTQSSFQSTSSQVNGQNCEVPDSNHSAALSKSNNKDSMPNSQFQGQFKNISSYDESLPTSNNQEIPYQASNVTPSIKHENQEPASKTDSNRTVSTSSDAEQSILSSVQDEDKVIGNLSSVPLDIKRELFQEKDDKSLEKSEVSKEISNSISDNRIVAKSWCVQKSKAYQCTHRWTIENFNFYGKSKISGSKFSPSDEHQDQDQGFKWSICLYPKQKPDNDIEEEYISLYLWMNRTEREAVPEAKVTFLFAILDSEDYDFTLVPYSPDSSGWGFPKFLSWNILREDMDRYFPNNSLTIFCKIKTLVDFDTEIGPKTSEMNIDFLDYDNLWKNREVTYDVMFYVGKERKEFYAHKTVLKTRFWYYYDEVQNETNHPVNLYIENLDPVLFDEMLKFIYKRDLSMIALLGQKLLSVAHKYRLYELKGKCEESLIEQIDTVSVVDLLLLADTYDAAKLKSKCIDYIRKHPNEVMASDDWLNLLVEQPYLVVDVFNIS